jgi:hypothetical protein
MQIEEEAWMKLKLRTKSQRREYLLRSLIKTLKSILDDAENGSSIDGEPVDYYETKQRLNSTIKFFELQLSSQKALEDSRILDRVRRLFSIGSDE